MQVYATATFEKAVEDGCVTWAFLALAFARPDGWEGKVGKFGWQNALNPVRALNFAAVQKFRDDGNASSVKCNPSLKMQPEMKETFI